MPNAIVHPRDPRRRHHPHGARLWRCRTKTTTWAPSWCGHHRLPRSVHARGTSRGCGLQHRGQGGQMRRVSGALWAVGCVCHSRLSNTYTRLPASSPVASRGPPSLIAIATGSADAMSRLPQDGLRGEQFTTRTGRTDPYVPRQRRTDASGTCLQQPPRWQRGQRRVSQYDMVVWDCEGSNTSRNGTEQTRLRTYIDGGGRFFASHWSRDWLPERHAGQLGELGRRANNSDRLRLVRSPRANSARFQTYARWLHHQRGQMTTDGSGNPVRLNNVVEPRDLAIGQRGFRRMDVPHAAYDCNCGGWAAAATTTSTAPPFAPSATRSAVLVQHAQGRRATTPADVSLTPASTSWAAARGLPDLVRHGTELSAQEKSLASCSSTSRRASRR